MATYTELRNLFQDAALLGRTATGTVIAANDLLSGTPTAADKAYAALVFQSPETEARKALMAVLATNSGLSVAQIQGASDTALQSAIDTVVPNLRDALAGV